MGHNPSRYTIKAIEADTQRAVDEYKSRSMWGRWWSLSADAKSRYFTKDERAWINRYGARLDEIACMAVEPRNDRERQFLAVCLRHELPQTERQRLWLRAQMVCRYEDSLERAARTDLAEHRNAAMRGELQQLRIDLRAAEHEAMQIVTELRMLRGDDGPEVRRADANATWVTPRFRSSATGEPVARPYRPCS